jgi:hypothetical protein
MQSPDVRVPPRGRSFAHRASPLAVAGLVVALSACGSVSRASMTKGPHQGRTPGFVSRSGFHASSSAQPEDTGPIETAWLSAEQAFDSAALTSNAYEPDLAATTVAPQLNWTRSLLEQMRDAGQLAKGRIRFGAPSVTSTGTNQATVRACAHDEEIVVSATTGQPAPGNPGHSDFELFESTMTLTGGEWKLETQHVGAGQCHHL